MTLQSSPDQRLPINLPAFLGATVCSILWAGQSVAVKVALESFSPYSLMLVRVGLSGTFIMGWAAATHQPLRITPRQIVLVTINAFLLYAQIALYTLGTNLTSSIRSIVIVNSYPFFTAITSYLFLHNITPSRRSIAGLVVAFTGVVTLFLPQLIGISGGNLAGDLLVLLAAVMIGSKISYAKFLLRDLRPAQLVFWNTLFAIVLAVVLMWRLEPQPLHDHLTLRAIGAAIYQGVVVSGCAVLVWSRLLARHSPNDLNVFRMTTPFFGILAGWFVLSESFTGPLFLGAVFLSTGVILVTRRRLPSCEVSRGQ